MLTVAGQILLDAALVELAASLRIRMLFSFPPTPNDPDVVFHGQTITGMIFIQSCVRVVRALLKNPPTNTASCPYTPAQTYFGIIAACATLRQVTTKSSAKGFDSSAYLTLDELHRAEAFLACHQGLPGFIYRHMWKSIHDEEGSGDKTLSNRIPPLPTNGDGVVDWEAVFKDCDLDDLLASFINPAVGV